VILEKFNITSSKKSDVPEVNKKVVRTYGFKANDLPLGPDILFRGELISILECVDCSNTSIRTEYFLDLSLPVTEEKVRTLNAIYRWFYFADKIFSIFSKKKICVYPFYVFFLFSCMLFLCNLEQNTHLSLLFRDRILFL